MRIIVVLAVLILTGCAGVGVTPVKSAAAHPENCNIDVYHAANQIAKPYDVVCELDSHTGTSIFDDKTADAAIQLAKPEACKCGADAILIESSETEGMSLLQWGKGTAKIKAIRYK